MVREKPENRIKWKLIFQIFEEGIDDNIKFTNLYEYYLTSIESS